MEIDEICQRCTVVEARPEHADALARTMRAEDRAEVWATAHVDPRKGLEMSLSSSLYAWTWLVDGQPACMFGVSSESILSGIGKPWLLTGDLLDRQWPVFARHCRPFIRKMSDDFPKLENWVDARYRKAIRWLTWAGFYVFPPAPYGPDNLPFCRFEMYRRSDEAKPGLDIRKCSAAEIRGNPGFPALAAEYKAEAAIAGLPDPDEKAASYDALEKSGFFHLYGAFLDGKVIGLVAVLAPVVPHYGAVVATAESFFVVGAHRKTGAGLKLLKAAEAQAKEAGSPGLLISAPYGGRLAQVMPRLGYRETNRVFFKEVGHG